MEIETARESDIPELVELLRSLFAQESEFSPDASAQHKGLSTIIHNPHIGAILVLRDGATVLGMVNLLFTVSTALGEMVALLEDMVISPGVRGGGMGSMLLSYALTFARAKGCQRVTLLTDADNQAAQRFYSKHGFQHSSMVPLRISLA